MKKVLRRIMSLFLSVLITCMSFLTFGNFGVSANAANGKFAGGDGTENNPYLVSNAEQLDAVRDDLNAHYKQINNIDLADFGNWNPIGKDNSSSDNAEIKTFQGSFDGCGYSIFNLSINDTSESFTDASYGLFSGIGSGTVKNIVLKNINFFIDKSSVDYVELWKNYRGKYQLYAGGVAGRSNTVIDNCYVSGNIEIIHCNDAFIGGVVGHGKSENCYNATNIDLLADKDSRYKNDSYVYCGGIVGHAGSVNGKISNCANYGNINVVAGDFAYIGGISGEYGNIENCVNFGEITGSISGTNSYSSFAGNCNVGGIVGATSSEYTRYCVNYGSIKSSATTYMWAHSSYSGGIVGFCGYYGSGSIQNCVNIGAEITSKKVDKDGNLVDANAGRIAGFSINTAKCASLKDTKINNSFISTSNENDNNGLELTVDQLLQKASYVDFDFENVWEIDKTVGGAVLCSKRKDADSDGDGIPDDWEINGIDTNGDGKPEVDLKAMGADPTVPDIFVEVDWMVRPATKFLFWELIAPHSFKPSENAMRMVYNAFKKQNINLHIDVGPDSIDFVTGKRWGSLTGGNEVTYARSLKVDKGFDVWNNVLDMSDERSLVFHHCLFADSLYSDTANTTSGRTPGFGQCFAVTLGGWGTVNDTVVAGTFMHELGHSLGLKHGGCDHENYKPNYLSIMNYAFQTTGLEGTGSLDYSKYKLPDIDEEHIDENKGIDPEGLTAGTNLGTTLFYGTRSQITTGAISKSPIDFNGNGKLENDICLDLNPIVKPDGSITYKRSVLESYNDWEHINYKSGIIGYGTTLENNSFGKISNAELISEKTLQESLETSTLASDGSGCIELVSSTVIKNVDNQNLYFDVTNLGANDTAFSVKIESNLLPKAYSANVNVKGSKTQIEKVRIAVPVNSKSAEGTYDISFSITNKNNETISNTKKVTVYSPTETELKELNEMLNNSSLTKEVDADLLREMENAVEAKTKNPSVKNVQIKDLELKYKSSAKIEPNITADSGAKYTIKWESSNTKVATVDENGNVYAAKKGNATITCTVTDSNGNTVTDTCNVKVKYSFGQWLLIILLFGWIWY